MLRVVAVASLLCGPLPALAQDTVLVDDVVSLVRGLHDGYRTSYRGTVVNIARTSPGVFEIANDAHKGVTMVTELEPCVFTYAAEADGQAVPAVRIDLKNFHSAAYSAGVVDAVTGLTLFTVKFDAGPDLVMRDGQPVEARRAFAASLLTDAPHALLEKSVAALKAACPSE